MTMDAHKSNILYMNLNQPALMQDQKIQFFKNLTYTKHTQCKG